MSEAITLQLPDRLYQRLVNTAQATHRPLEAVIVQALEVGAPPDWDDIPAEFQAEVAALDRLEDAALWQVARRGKAAAEMTRYDELLDRNQAGTLTDAERWELSQLRQEADLFMICKAQAAAILRWRGHQIAVGCVKPTAFQKSAASRINLDLAPVATARPELEVRANGTKSVETD